MKLLIASLMILLSVGCVRKNIPENRGEATPKVPAAKMVANTDMTQYATYKYEDNDAICYSIQKSNSVSISCFPKNK